MKALRPQMLTVVWSMLQIACSTLRSRCSFLSPRNYFDWTSRKEDNILTVAGMLKAVRSVLQLKEFGLLAAGVPCSSFVWLNIVHTRRSESNPMGSGSCAPAQDRHGINHAFDDLQFLKCCCSILLVCSTKSHRQVGNNIALRAMLCFALALSRRVMWFCEQPATSWLPRLPVYQKLLSEKGHHAVFWWPEWT